MKLQLSLLRGGLGVFIPRKPPIFNIKEFENKGVAYIVKDPEIYRNKNIVISGGGDSALDWALFFANNFSKKVTLIHRSQSFRAHLDSVQQAMNMAEKGKINLILDAEVIGLDGNNKLEKITVKNKSQEEIAIDSDYWFAFIWSNSKIRTNC